MLSLWLRAGGSVAPNGVATVTVEYDVSQIDFQGIYTADVLITTNAQPIEKASTGNAGSWRAATNRFCCARGNHTDDGLMPALPRLRASVWGWLTYQHK